DLTPMQWDEVIDVIKQQQLIPFFDMAYQGYGESMADDAYVIRKIAHEDGVVSFAPNSFSKIFSLYGERVGGLSVVCGNAEEASRVLGQLKA
ncbi:aminotransferase class I/II-fold pyridoxal phosphate-dependent enzyme, partial [Vibrio alginolyticus]|uniref:aminotransferase class I/II-fold pyridoxal phosphate-dependent enzyme n=1 Tax=Vibrio alginolyticus TaxID=663 RepID=UPI001A8F40B8